MSKVGPGDQVGSYTLVRRLGAGGMGEVFLARHRVIGRLAAVKLMLAEVSDVREVVLRFIDEARAAALIDHPAIVEMLDGDILPDGRPFLVMEFLQGANVQEAFTRVPALRFDVPFVAGLLGELAHGLQAAHACGIVHRDVKPENAFLAFRKGANATLQVKILDFGIAKLLRPERLGTVTATGAVLGTPQYMSPEQCRGEPDIDHRSDIYSLGCLGFELFAGRPPFEAGPFGKLLISHATEPPPSLARLAPHAPARLARLIDSMLAKPPAERPQSMQQIIGAVAEFLGCAPGAFASHLAIPADLARDAHAADHVTAAAGRSMSTDDPAGTGTRPPANYARPAPPAVSAGATNARTSGRPRWLMAGGASMLLAVAWLLSQRSAPATSGDGSDAAQRTADRTAPAPQTGPSAPAPVVGLRATAAQEATPPESTASSMVTTRSAPESSAAVAERDAGAPPAPPSVVRAPRPQQSQRRDGAAAREATPGRAAPAEHARMPRGEHASGETRYERVPSAPDSERRYERMPD